MKFKMADNTDEELSIGWFSIISLTFRIRNLIQDFSVKIWVLRSTNSFYDDKMSQTKHICDSRLTSANQINISFSGISLQLVLCPYVSFHLKKNKKN